MRLIEAPNYFELAGRDRDTIAAQHEARLTTTHIQMVFGHHQDHVQLRVELGIHQARLLVDRQAHIACVELLDLEAGVFLGEAEPAE